MRPGKFLRLPESGQPEVQVGCSCREQEYMDANEQLSVYRIEMRGDTRKAETRGPGLARD